MGGTYHLCIIPVGRQLLVLQILRVKRISSIIIVRSWMSKFGHVFWEDVRKYAKDLEAFLGMSPYDFFEHYKYYEYDK